MKRIYIQPENTAREIYKALRHMQVCGGIELALQFPKEEIVVYHTQYSPNLCATNENSNVSFGGLCYPELGDDLVAQANRAAHEIWDLAQQL